MIKLALLLGEGALARAAYEAAQQEFGSDSVAGFALCRKAWPELPLFDLDDLGAAISMTKQAAPELISVAGRVDLSPERRDKMVASLHSALPEVARDTSDLGLEILFGVVAQLIGARPIGVHEFAARLLAAEGHLFGQEADVNSEIYSKLLTATRKFGETDLGQSLVFAGVQPVVGEDIAGTDALLHRVKALATHTPFVGELTLVKAKKPQQTGVGDLPTIGRRTVELAAEVGISTILVEAGATLVLDQDELDALCHKTGVRIIGAQ
ncbi:DUF1009 family protein [Maritalea mobilis]|uniref:DUF1009 family protein n=1 Tax=Maritalea mobilis TaxID=483324 RepID=A0A4R6VQQ9_9HYPH|nr:UDP-2,3-diacylglucosamine diphosphatase LpxI [Maritalea mobilis]TDQ66359.1 DUF1009 family protein [Maritalea mobilis]